MGFSTVKGSSERDFIFIVVLAAVMLGTFCKAFLDNFCHYRGPKKYLRKSNTVHDVILVPEVLHVEFGEV